MYDPLLPTKRRLEQLREEMTLAERESMAANARDVVATLVNLPDHDEIEVGFSIVAPGVANILATLLKNNEPVGSIPVARITYDDLKRSGRH